MKNDNTKVSNNRQKKEQLVAEMSDKVGKSKAMVLTNYQGMTHKQLEELKRSLKKANAELVVTKNTLLNRSLSEQKLPSVEDLSGQTATLFAYEDPILPLKELAKTIKALNLPVIKVGFFEGNLITADQVQRLSTLPSKEVLIAQLLGMMNSPITGLVRSLNWNMQKFAMTLKAIEEKKAQTTS